jgi:hypothetical protein
MASTFVDLVKIQTLSAGTGPFLLGPPVEGFRGTGALIDGREYSYSVQLGGNYEFGRGVYSQIAGELSRSVLGSSRNGSPVDFAAGAIVTFTLLSIDLSVFNPVDAINSVSIDASTLGFEFDLISNIDGSLILGMTGRLNPAGGGVPEDGLRYRINVPVIAAPTADEVLGLDVADVEYVFPADFDGSAFRTSTNPTATTVLTIEKLSGGAPVEIGTVTISTAGVATFATTDNDAVIIAPGEAVRIMGPTDPDTTLANFALKLVGTL